MEQFIGNRHPLRRVLAIEGVLALHNAHVRPRTQLLCRLAQREGDVKIRHGRELDRRVLPAGALMAHRARCNDQVARADFLRNAAAGADPHEGVHADGGQFLHRDGGGGAADAGGGDGDLHAVQRAGIGGEFAVAPNEGAAGEVRRDFFASSGIAGEDAVCPHVAGRKRDVELPSCFVHGEAFLSASVRFDSL